MNSVLKDLLKQPSLMVLHFQQKPLSAKHLSNILSQAYMRLGLNHLDQQAEQFQKKKHVP